MAQQVKRLTKTADLLFEVKDTFQSSIHPPSLAGIMVERKLLKKKEKKFLDIGDSSTQSSYIYSKFFRSDQRFTLSSQEFIDLLKATNNDKNIDFAMHLQKLHDEADKHFLKVQTTSPSEEALEDSQTVLHAEDKESLLPDLPGYPLLRTGTSTTGPMHIHSYPDEPASAVFTSEGGILYSPYHGVTVFIPEGAIPDQLRVTVSFRLITDQTERSELLDHTDFPSTAIPIGCMFDFSATIETKAEPAENLDTFNRDVWLSIPIFAYPTEESNSSSFSVLVQSNDSFEREQSAIFAFNYPYVNVSTRHFSKRVAVEESKIFSHHRRRQVYKRDTSRSDDSYPLARNVSLKKKHLDNGLSRTPSKPDSFDEVRQNATACTNSPASKRLLYAEAKKVSNEASTSQEKDQPSEAEIHKVSQLPDHQSSEDRSEGISPELMSEPEEMDTGDPLCVEPHSPCTVPLILWIVEQGEAAHCDDTFSADLCLLPHLPESFNQMRELRRKDRRDVCMGFKWKSSQDIVHFISASNTSPGWSVHLSRHQILINDVTCCTAFFGDPSLSLENLPAARATVKNNGAEADLYHTITVADSEPVAVCTLQLQGPKSLTPGLVKSPPVEAGIDVSLSLKKDRCLFALLSVVIPKSELRRLVASLGLDPIVASQEESRSELDVCERNYNVFCRALVHGNLTYGKLADFMTSCPSPDEYEKYLPLCRSYLAYRTQPLVQSLQGTECHLHFVQWAVEVLSLRRLHCITLKIAECDKPSISDNTRDNPFRIQELARGIVVVWKMFGRLCGLEDQQLDMIATQYSSNQADEAPFQMLRRLVQEFPQVTLSHISSVLQILLLGTGAVAHAVRDFDLILTSKQC